VRRGLPAAIAVALLATLVTGLAAATTRDSGGAKACLNAKGELRLLTQSSCPKGEHPTTLGQRGPEGPRGPKGATGRSEPPEHDVVGETTNHTGLATSKNAVATVVALASVPAGSWLFSSEVTVVNFGRADYFRCKIVAGKGQIASAASTVGTPGATTAGVPPASTTVANLSLIGAVSEPKPFTARLQCWHDLKTKGQPPYIDPGAVMLARPTASISASTS
jgi:hypothetical protein